MTREELKAYEEQLKPCPFCGGKAQIFNSFGWFWARCLCVDCKINPSTNKYYIDNGLDGLVRAWNMREREKND